MAGERIVIIDDDPDVREALTLMLEPAGYKLTCCSTGPEGTAAIQADPPDLILLDIMLASPTEGFHLAYEFKKDERIARIPIIMISAIGQTMGMDYAKELGSDYVPVEKFLDKPLRADVIRQAVQEALAKQGNK
ncbi:MAG: response regulator [Planctomycetes bacterium]|nr:response regulator [Planctomycetota bacterium]